MQGVGFRPFVYRLAQRLRRCAAGCSTARAASRSTSRATRDALDAFARAIVDEAPPAARIASLDVAAGASRRFRRRSPSARAASAGAPTARIAPDLPVCDGCLRELFDPADRRYRYPYITCTDCGPRYSIVTGLPYDRPFTTMARLADVRGLRARVPRSGRPAFSRAAARVSGVRAGVRAARASARTATLARAADAIAAAAALLARRRDRRGQRASAATISPATRANAVAVAALRERKYRKERPFALMARDLATARTR